MKRVVFIGACYPEEILDTFIKKNDIRQVSAYVYGWNIVKGLEENGLSVSVVNEHKGNRFPKGTLYTSAYDIIINSIELFNYKYLNISYLERISKANSIYKIIKKLKPRQIIVYSLHTPYLYPAMQYAKRNDCKVIVVIPDLPQFMFAKKNKFREILKKFDYVVIKKTLRKCDGYVVLVENMVKELNLSKPYTVIEGIAVKDDCTDDQIRNLDKQTTKYILYTGEISREYGIDTLIHAFSQIDSDGCELWLCGDGDYVDEVRKASLSDLRIKYKGFCDRVKLKKLRKNAILLVNPRNAEDEYTKYSFPSKTMEYLAAGVPVMMERLEGIPEEYYKYIIQVKNHNWKESIENFLRLSYEERKIIGRLGQEFVDNEKNLQKQGKKICELLREI